MSIFEHQRWEVFSAVQHPYKHNLADFSYSNPALGGSVTNLEQAMDWVFAVLYPSMQDTVDTTTDLPAAGNTINDMRVVLDDGDGKAATYRWEKREGDPAAKWYKIYDMDWGYDSILSGLLAQTQDLYVTKYGRDDIDDTGALLTGNDAGQHIFGGLSANSHLTLHANSGDDTGPQTGFIQFADNVRPTIDSQWSLGTDPLRWLKVWTDEITIGTMTIVGGSIVDSSGAIDFDDTSLTTTGSIVAGDVDASLGTFGDLSLSSGSITDASGAISFDDEDLSTQGTLAVSTLFFDTGSITDSTGTIDFDDEDLTTSGSILCSVMTADEADIGIMHFESNAISVLTTNENLWLSANGTGLIIAQSTMQTGQINVAGGSGVWIQSGDLLMDHLSFSDQTIATFANDESIILDPHGTGLVEFRSGIFPGTDSAFDIGKSGNVWNKLWLDGAIGDGTTEITSATLQSLRDINSGVTAGMSIFWNGSKWVSSIPDSEIDHGTVSGLGDDDHTQYALLLGRSGGQTLIGGTAASDSLTLDSTSNVTKGKVYFASSLSPSTDGALNIGDATHRIRDFYMTGEGHGLCLENFTTAARPAASIGTKGRILWDTDLKDIFVDVGGSWRQITSEQYYEEDATNWNGLQTTVTYNVSSSVDEAKKMVWVLKNNSDNYKQVLAEIDFPSNTQVRVTVGMPLTAGTYTLVGR